MNRKPLILSLVALGVVGAFAYRALSQEAPAASIADANTTAAAVAADTAPRPVPRLIELGSNSCASCKAMKPVLAELRAAHKGALRVDFYDVWKEEARAKEFKVKTIPVQVFQAPDGRELYRHMGFYPADKIRAKWAELGFPLPTAEPAS